MRAVVQRVSSASVSIEGTVVGAIGPGFLVLLGIQNGDTVTDLDWLAPKIAGLRVFEDTAGKMNHSLLDLVGGASRPDSVSSGSVSASSGISEGPPVILVVSQFTLLASTRKGNRPSFNDAAKPELARPLCDAFVAALEKLLGRPVATGQFGAMMQVSLVNDGPVTLLLDSRLRE